MSSGPSHKTIGKVKEEIYKGIKITVWKNQKYPLRNKEYFYTGYAYQHFFSVREIHKLPATGAYTFPISFQEYITKEKVPSIVIRKLKVLIDKYLHKHDDEVRLFNDIINMKKDTKLRLIVDVSNRKKVILLKIKGGK